MSPIAHPTAIEYVKADHLLKMTFSDGHETAYPALYLRGYCPCARCQGHSSGPPKWQTITSPRQIEVLDVTPVGTYALCIAWGDGHDTGIYSFENLRRMCPCPSCKPEGLPTHEVSLRKS